MRLGGLSRVKRHGDPAVLTMSLQMPPAVLRQGDGDGGIAVQAPPAETEARGSPAASGARGGDSARKRTGRTEDP